MALITAETAREYQQRAARARVANRRAGGHEQPQAAPQNPAADGFVLACLARTRAQLNALDEMLNRVLSVDADKVDGQLIDRLASAKARFHDVERILAGRPTPGSRRPAPDRPKRTGPSADLW
jgi:hypothetical protein